MPEFIGANMFLKKTCLKEIGGLREDLGPGRGTFGDDTDVFARSKRLNKKISYCGEALVWHKVDIKRATLKYISYWWIAQGRYTARKNFFNKGKKIRCIVGVPGYLLKEILFDSFRLPWKIYNRRNFIKTWQRLFWRIGSALEYRKLDKCKKLA